MAANKFRDIRIAALVIMLFISNGLLVQPGDKELDATLVKLDAEAKGSFVSFRLDLSILFDHFCIPGQ